ncbi:low molecular weight phosphotyrosine protein phosphatase 1-like [Bacillus rossius redtenbacheri]|uniref:low molecular weight phosphotyrosine protein phosphatase 1-like n=1 Tax=Bacillus rossius redtenbacheri TaxID=93214 RepID=UPI002FDE182B
MATKQSALFICLGNICRSPIAEAVFQNILKERDLQNDWHVDSAALGSWHVGKSPDRRAMNTIKRHGIEYRHKARQIQKDDFNQFDYIFGKDEENMRELKRLAPTGSKAKLILLGSFDPEGDPIIRDPYYDDGDEGFEKCFQQCVRSINAFLDSLKN